MQWTSDPDNLVVFAIILLLVFLIIQEFISRYANRQSANTVQSGQHPNIRVFQNFSRESLSKFTGDENMNQPILVAVSGKVFDVSRYVCKY